MVAWLGCTYYPDIGSTTMSSLDDTLACAACGGGSGGNVGELSSSTKKCTSCEQKKSEHCKDGASDSTSRSSGIDAVSDILGRLDIPNNDDDDKLFADPPPKEDCEICMLPMPFHSGGAVKISYQSCCGKMICCGCIMAAQEEWDKGTMKCLCPFCRQPYPRSDSEAMVKRIEKRIRLNDPEAFFAMAYQHIVGNDCFPPNIGKALEILKQGAEFGSVSVHAALAQACFVDKDMEKANYHWKIAAMGGHEGARYNLGMSEYSTGNSQNKVRGMKHFMIAARCGCDKSLDIIKMGYESGYFTKDEYASTLQAYTDCLHEMKSEQRTKAMQKSKEERHKLNEEKIRS